MEIRSITMATGEILKELCQVAEAEIERELTAVALKAIDDNKARIIDRVKKQLSVTAHAAFIQSMDSAGMNLQITFQPKR